MKVLLTLAFTYRAASEASEHALPTAASGDAFQLDPPSTMHTPDRPDRVWGPLSADELVRVGARAQLYARRLLARAERPQGMSGDVTIGGLSSGDFAYEALTRLLSSSIEPRSRVDAAELAVAMVRNLVNQFRKRGTFRTDVELRLEGYSPDSAAHGSPSLRAASERLFADDHEGRAYIEALLVLGPAPGNIVARHMGVTVSQLLLIQQRVLRVLGN